MNNKDLATLLLEAKDASKRLNQAIVEDSHKNIKAEKTAAIEAVDEYNAQLRIKNYQELLATDNPFLEAIKRCYIPAIKLLVSVDKQSKLEKSSIEEVEEIINLIELEDMATRLISHNGQWRYWIEKFNYVMVARATSDIGGDTKKFKKSFKMSETARSCDIGAIPVATIQICKQLQMIIDGILFEDNGAGLNAYKALNMDVKFILYTMCHKGSGKLTVSMPRTSTMIKLVTEVLHRIVTKAAYTAEYDMIKK